MMQEAGVTKAAVGGFSVVHVKGRDGTPASCTAGTFVVLLILLLPTTSRRSRVSHYLQARTIHTTR